MNRLSPSQRKANTPGTREHDRKTVRRRMETAAFRQRILDLFGGKCVKCGFSDPRALQLDHIKADKSVCKYRTGRHLYSSILDGRVSKEHFQLLCANCNWIKRVENGELPERRFVESFTPSQDDVKCYIIRRDSTPFAVTEEDRRHLEIFEKKIFEEILLEKQQK